MPSDEVTGDEAAVAEATLPDGLCGDGALSLPLPAARRRALGWRPAWAAAGRIVYAGAALFLFVLALVALKGAAMGVTGLLEGVSAQGTANILGFGWLGAYFVLSGSPVSAIALSLFAGSAISDSEAFAMLNGSRLGASFIVLLVGFVYYLGKRRSADGIFIGVVALLTTFTIHVPVVPLGSLVLNRGWFDAVELPTPTLVVDFTNAVFKPGVDLALTHVPRPLVFIGGVGLLLASLTIFDRSLPNLQQTNPRVERIKGWLHDPWAMFLLGLLVTAVTLSVSISLTLLIPLSMKGFVRRDGIIPFVLGANISTSVDTMVAALLLDSPRAFTIVFTQMSLTAAVSLLVLLVAYRPYSRAVLAVASRATQSRLGLAMFLGIFFMMPLVLFLT